MGYSHDSFLIAIDDLYDLRDKNPDEYELEKIKESMILLMPARHPIGLKLIENLFKSMKDESNLDLSQSLTQYLRVSSQSIGAQVVIPNPFVKTPL